MKCPEALALSITAAAIAVARELTNDEIALLSSAAMQFGDTLSTLAAARDDPPAIEAPPARGNQSNSTQKTSKNERSDEK